jgi:hypothetical protein
MRSLSLFLLFCVVFTPYHAQLYPFSSVLSELYPLLCAAFPFSFVQSELHPVLCAGFLFFLLFCLCSIFAPPYPAQPFSSPYLILVSMTLLLECSA